MHASLFNMLHQTADYHLLAIRHRIHIHFDGVIQESIQQHWRIVGNADCFGHVATQFRFLVHNLHGATTQHIGRTHHQWIADFFCKPHRLFRGTSRSVGRLSQIQTLNHLLEALTIFCTIDRIRCGTNNRHAGSFQIPSQLQWGLPTELDDNPFGLLKIHNGQHVFKGYRFEIQSIRRVVIR